ncbi:hypothetical protein ABIE64_002469 [Thalassospira sp. MBR-102]|uniref:hypothetical protein n=1 Tax=Thalassospira sp. MBR-102 TaxID=3156466 RepID=UPI003392A960
MQLKKICPRYRMVLVTLTCLLRTVILTEPAKAQEDQWVAETFNQLDILVDQNRLMLASNVEALDTEIPGGFVQLIMSLPVKVMGQTVIAGGSKILCEYDPVRNVSYIPASCYRILTPEGYDYRIVGQIYDRNGRRGIPADRQKKNGALQADYAKELQLIIEQVTAVGFPGHLWKRSTPNKE